MKNKIKIPKKFKLLGQTYSVKYDETLYYDREVFGLCDYSNNKIVIQPETESINMPKDQVEHTYLHEILHVILKNINSAEMSKDEGFIDALAGGLQQILQTSKY